MNEEKVKELFNNKHDKLIAKMFQGVLDQNNVEQDY